MPSRHYRKSVSAIAVAVGFVATPAVGQETADADLLATYPALAGIEDRSCLGPLAELEAERGPGTLLSVLQGETAAADFPEADEELRRCLLAAEDAAAAGAMPEAASPAPETEAQGEAAGLDTAGEDPAETNSDPDAAEAVPGQEDDPAAGSEQALPIDDQAPADQAAKAPDAETTEEEAVANAAPEAADAGVGEDLTATEAEAPVAEEPDATAPLAEQPDTDTPDAADMDADLQEDSAEAEIVEEVPATEAEAPLAEEPDATAPLAAEPDADAPDAADMDADLPTESTQEARPEDSEAAAQAAADAETESTDPAAGAETVATEDTAEEGSDEALRDALEAEEAAGGQETDAVTEDADASTQVEQAAVDEPPEAVQEDTAAAMEAANEPVTVQAAEAGEAEPETVETEVVTEETARSSAEEFEEPAESDVVVQEEDDDDDDGIRIGQVAAGVLGGIVLNELLGANEEVVANTGDRVVVERGAGDYYVLKDENALLRRPGSEVETQRFSDGSTREIISRPDGTRVVTIRAANGRVVRRERILPDGQRVVLFDDTEQVEPVEPDRLPQAQTTFVEYSDDMDAAALRRALAREETRFADRRFSLRQVREIRAVRNLVPTIQLETVNFETDSAAIRPSEAEELSAIGRAMRRMIEENPYEVFLIEGHTDAVGPAAYNLALSDRRAESVALALAEYFDVPPENMVVQGYGESNLRIPTAGPERANRRAAVRRITPLLNSARLR